MVLLGSLGFAPEAIEMIKEQWMDSEESHLTTFDCALKYLEFRIKNWNKNFQTCPTATTGFPFNGETLNQWFTWPSTDIQSYQIVFWIAV